VQREKNNWMSPWFCFASTFRSLISDPEENAMEVWSYSIKVEVIDLKFITSVVLCPYILYCVCRPVLSPVLVDQANHWELGWDAMSW
jgi:hypothetical protein